MDIFISFVVLDDTVLFYRITNGGKRLDISSKPFFQFYWLASCFGCMKVVSSWTSTYTIEQSDFEWCFVEEN